MDNFYWYVFNDLQVDDLAVIHATEEKIRNEKIVVIEPKRKYGTENHACDKKNVKSGAVNYRKKCDELVEVDN